MKYLALLAIPAWICAVYALFRWTATTDRKWPCRMGWHHEGDGVVSHDGCSFGRKCPRCGKNLLQDSQGNWFSTCEVES